MTINGYYMFIGKYDCGCGYQQLKQFWTGIDDFD